MRKHLSQFAIVILLSQLLLSIATNEIYGDGKARNGYRIEVLPKGTEDQTAGGWLGTVEAPEVLAVNSSSPLSPEKQKLLAWHFRNAARLAQSFAAAEQTRVQRQILPGRVEVCDSPAEVAQATGRPAHERLGEVVARMDLRRGIVYLGRKTCEDLYVELGKWLYYEPTFRWGVNRSEDQKRLQLAERFARYCLDEKRWTEAGGSKDSIR